jgi:hypothetical protein
MPATYFDPGQGNFFGYKHLYIIDGPASVETLLNEGERVLRERRTAANAKKNKEHPLVQVYGGSTKPDENTLIVLSQGGFQTLDTAVLNFGATVPIGKKRVLHFQVSNAAVFHADINGTIRAATSGEVLLRVGRTVEYIYVDHFDGMSNMRWMMVGMGASKQLLSTSFRVTPGELQTAITQLRHVPPPSVKLPPAIVYGVPGLDLGFLDD